ncbi:MAG: hypothetical protein ACRDJE_11165 [Dehalococcoidia bacterium]
MTQITTDQRRMEAAVTSVATKLEGFQEALSPDERFMLSAALWKAGAARGAADDVAGYRTMLDIAVASVEKLPIWGSLQQMVADLTRPIDFNRGFDGSPPYSPR